MFRSKNIWEVDSILRAPPLSCLWGVIWFRLWLTSKHARPREVITRKVSRSLPTTNYKSTKNHVWSRLEILVFRFVDRVVATFKNLHCVTKAGTENRSSIASLSLGYNPRNTDPKKRQAENHRQCHNCTFTCFERKQRVSARISEHGIKASLALSKSVVIISSAISSHFKRLHGTGLGNRKGRVKWRVNINWKPQLEVK